MTPTVAAIVAARAPDGDRAWRPVRCSDGHDGPLRERARCAKPRDGSCPHCSARANSRAQHHRASRCRGWHQHDARRAHRTARDAARPRRLPRPAAAIPCRRRCFAPTATAGVPEVIVLAPNKKRHGQLRRARGRRHATLSDGRRARRGARVRTRAGGRQIVGPGNAYVAAAKRGPRLRDRFLRWPERDRDRLGAGNRGGSPGSTRRRSTSRRVRSCSPSRRLAAAVAAGSRADPRRDRRARSPRMADRPHGRWTRRSSSQRLAPEHAVCDSIASPAVSRARGRSSSALQRAGARDYHRVNLCSPTRRAACAEG